ncbi:MAG: RIP metalloprotease RseP [Lachnospiraceae bacterium]|nr:RIP metalloprotease RseP [Lachnospiraceae bacterium]
MDFSFIWTIISFILIFSAIVIFHEGGHFLLARINGIKVLEFTVGLGPKLIHFQKGGTEFSLRALPFGGACIFENPDELEDEEEEKENEEKLTKDLESDKTHKSFKDASVWSRIITVFAGPLFNIVLAYILGLFVVFFCGETLTTVDSVMDGYPAKEAGIQAGDVITKINGERVYLFNEIRLITFVDDSEIYTVEFLRDGQKMSVSFNPRNEGGQRMLGISSKDFVSCSNLSMFKYSALEVRYWLKATFKSLKMLFTGKLSKDDLSGPVGVAQVIDTTIDETKQYGVFTVILNMVNIAVLLSVNLGIMNLLPLPALDGGRLVFLLIEAVIGKAVPRKAEAYIHLAGIVLLLIVSVFVFFNDITKFFR